MKLANAPCNCCSFRRRKLVLTMIANAKKTTNAAPLHPSPNACQRRLNCQQQHARSCKDRAARLNWRAKVAAETYRASTSRELTPGEKRPPRLQNRRAQPRSARLCLALRQVPSLDQFKWLAVKPAYSQCAAARMQRSFCIFARPRIRNRLSATTTHQRSNKL